MNVDASRACRPAHPAASLPAHADRSTLVARMRSRNPSSQMPPLGTVTVDEAAVALLTAWIAADAATWNARRVGC